jgi:hypothetical protein
MATTTARTNDVDTLHALNDDYIRSVQQSDVRRFDEILADDFRCSNPDSSLVNRDGFLKQTAVPVRFSNLEARDVEVRVLGDVAIIHARTMYTLPDGRVGGAVHRRVDAARRHLARRLRARHPRLATTVD